MEYDSISFKFGLAMALCSMAMQWHKPEPAKLFIYGTPSESGNIGLRTGDGVVLCNGVVANIDDVYTNELKAEYPFACVMVDKNNGLCILKLEKEAQKATEYGTVGITSSDICYSYQNGLWERYTVAFLTYRHLVWANHDVYYVEAFGGGLFMSAADPIPVSGIVGYDYNNSVVLPKLPEWDKEKYPYARIFYNGSRAHLYISSTPLLFEPGTNAMTSGGFYNPDANGSYFSYLLILADGMWEQNILVTDYESGQESYAFWSAWPLLWSNYDITTEDGAVYLAASDPIPIYEQEE